MRLRSTATCLFWYSWSIRKNTMRWTWLVRLLYVASSHLFNYLFILSLIQAKSCSSASIARLKNLNRRTVDVLASRLYFYYSLSYELTESLSEIRGWVKKSFFCVYIYLSYCWLFILWMKEKIQFIWLNGEKLNMVKLIWLNAERT